MNTGSVDNSILTLAQDLWESLKFANYGTCYSGGARFVSLDSATQVKF